MLYFDNISLEYSSLVGTYEITKEEIVEVATRWDPQPFHVDEQAADRSVFGGLTASSLHLFAIMTRLFFDHDDQIQIMAMLSKNDIRLHNPARPGDRLTYRTKCVERRASSTKNDRGVITLFDELVNQKSEQVLSQRVSLLVRRKT